MVYQIVTSNRRTGLRQVAALAALLVSTAHLSLGCPPAPGPPPHGDDMPGGAASTSPTSATPPTATKTATAAAAVERPKRPLSMPEARRYMLALVNRDRASNGLAPVELDEGPPTASGQAHAEDMVRLGYLGHWGSDGSVPEHRYTQAGGTDMVLENALCFTDEKTRTLDPNATIDPAQIEKAESQFYDEVPPNDGHRKNILKPQHTRVGIGVAQPKGTATEIAVPCFSQEFVDGYGAYGAVPRHAKAGAVVHVDGTLAAGVVPTGVGLARVDAPKAMPASALNKLRTYQVPKPFQMYWGPGFVSPVPVKIDGQRFGVDVPLSDHDKPGLYEVSVWAKLAPDGEHTMVSLRTVIVD
jgi:uncharacterized protein YkwD